MKKPLASFRYEARKTIATLEGMKSIMRVTAPRKVYWWLVLPAVGENDSVCVLIDKCPRWEIIHNWEARILKTYADRILSA